MYTYSNTFTRTYVQTCIRAYVSTNTITWDKNGEIENDTAMY